jgi:hypothetical protein
MARFSLDRLEPAARYRGVHCQYLLDRQEVIPSARHQQARGLKFRENIEIVALPDGGAHRAMSENGTGSGGHWHPRTGDTSGILRESTPFAELSTLAFRCAPQPFIVIPSARSIDLIQLSGTRILS